MATDFEKQEMRRLWPDHTLADVAKRMKRSRSWVHMVSKNIGLPAKPQNFRKRTAIRLELGKEALSLRRANWKWGEIADKLGLCSKGHACTLAAIAEKAELDARAKAA